MTARACCRFVLGLLLAVTAGKVVIALQLPLFVDEAFYWLCAQHPALHYADHPLLNATLVRAGTALVGDSTLGVRFFHLLLGLLLPLLVVLHARPIVGERDAWIAGGLALAIPGLAIAGVVAIPDVPLTILTLLLLMSVERGTRSMDRGPWIAAGIVAALGLATHYRFSVAIAAAAGFLVSTDVGRRALRRPWPWIAAGIGAIGAIPIILHNLGTELHALRYYVSGRHDASLRAEGLVDHLAEQMMIASPIFYVLLLGMLVALARGAQRGDRGAAVHLWFAALPIGVFLLASPLHSAELETVHWPLVGYLAVLPLAPAMLGRLAKRGPWQRAIVVSGPALGIALGVLTIAGMALDSRVTVAASRPFRGWPEAAAMVEAQLANSPAPQIVVADNYKIGAILAFYLNDQIELYILDHYKNHKHGRQPQLAVWNMDEAALRGRCGTPAIVIIDNDELPLEMREDWFNRVPLLFENFEQTDVARVPEPGGRRVREFRLYRSSGFRCDRDWH